MSIIPISLQKNSTPQLVQKNPNYHNTSGFMTVGRFPHEDKNVQVIIDAWKELGTKETDYNAQTQVGVSRLQFTTVNGSRLSSNGAFLRPVRKSRPNLRVMANSKVRKILINEETKEAEGVEYFCPHTNSWRKVYASKEVIVSAGAFDSPKLLMLSGIGPLDHLKEVGIETIKDLPVGQNLHEHTVAIPFEFRMTKAPKFSYSKIKRDLTFWENTRKGPLSALGAESTVAFLQTSFESRSGVPDIQVGFAGTVAEDTNCESGFSATAISYYNKLTMFVVLLKPKSRGYLKLNATDPEHSQPLIYLNSLTENVDVKTFVEGVQLSQKIAETKTFKKAGFKLSRNPGCTKHKLNSAEYFECMVKKYSLSAYHPVGTCKMGPKKDKSSVVDSRLRVIGVPRLRVIDASVMPETTRGSIHAPIVMIAEKGSDMIKEDYSLK